MRITREFTVAGYAAEDLEDAAFLRRTIVETINNEREWDGVIAVRFLRIEPMSQADCDARNGDFGGERVYEPATCQQLVFEKIEDI